MPSPFNKLPSWVLPYIHLRDEKGNNSTGGGTTAGTTVARTLNTKVIDTHNLCTLAANQFVLKAGTYYMMASAPSFAAGRHRARLRNVSPVAATLLLGTSEYGTAAGDQPSTRSLVMGRFTVEAGQLLELQQYFQATQASNGMGINANTGDIEIFTVVELWRLP